MNTCRLFTNNPLIIEIVSVGRLKLIDLVGIKHKPFDWKSELATKVLPRLVMAFDL